MLLATNNGIIERLAPHYALIERKSLDHIVRAAQKKDAVITLFEDGDDVD